MVQQVRFMYTGSPGIVARRTLTGDVLEQRARRDGGTDLLIKSPDLPFAKWINVEFTSSINAKATAIAAEAASTAA